MWLTRWNDCFIRGTSEASLWSQRMEGEIKVTLLDRVLSLWQVKCCMYLMHVLKVGILNLEYYIIFVYFFQLLTTSFNWEIFSWLTNKKFIFSVKSKPKKYVMFCSRVGSLLCLMNQICICRKKPRNIRDSKFQISTH